MYLFAAAEASSNGGLIDALGIKGQLFLVQGIAFLILVGLLGKFVWPVLIKAIDARRSAIEAGLEEAKQSREALDKANEKADKLLAAARKDADAVISRGQQEAAGVIAEAEAKAKVRAERLVADAHKQLEADIAKARRDLKKDTAELVASATERIIHEKLDDKKDASLIERSLSGAS
ncbi:MAG: atpF [Candidatus Saccharibacteria bacterium]|nr:atpF [Candidatus Saccharibacteria bacterium]